jgi:carbon monoxide dehydrogenase subunit G
MRVEGTRDFEASRERVWAVISDPAGMAGLMPGVEGFEVIDDTHWRAKVKVPLGLGGLKMTMDFEQLEERPLEFASMRGKGKGMGAMMDMTTSFTLSGEGDSTHMEWGADVKLAGVLGSMGQRVLQPIINQQVEGIMSALETQLAAQGAA